MTFDEMLRAYEKGEMINFNAFTGVRSFQVYNYPRENIMVGCISVNDPKWDGTSTRNYKANGLDERDLTEAEYQVMMTAKSQVEQLKKHIPGFEGAFIIDTPRAGVRETRHIVGEYRLCIEDILNSSTFTDSIGKGSHPIDVSPVPDVVKNAPKPEVWSFSIPFRCMIPKGIENLLVAGNAAQLFGNFLSGSAGNTGIHLVENQGRNLILLSQNVLHSQHNSGQFATGGDFAQRLQGLTGIGRHIECHGIGSVGSQLQFGKFAGELYPGHIQLGKLAENPLREDLRCGNTVIPEQVCCISGGFFCFVQLEFQAFQVIIGKFNFVQFLLCRLQVRKNISAGCTVFFAKPVNNVEP
jgi:hypothetical protein